MLAHQLSAQNFAHGSFGQLSAKFDHGGDLKLASAPGTTGKSRSSVAVSPGFSTTQAFTVSPRYGSGTPATPTLAL